jgi:lambda repressor-like predicted transcriptional regulator
LPFFLSFFFAITASSRRRYGFRPVFQQLAPNSSTNADDARRRADTRRGEDGATACRMRVPGVDLWGRLSNPHEILPKLADQGWSSRERRPNRIVGSAEQPDSGTATGPPEQRGRLSNPVQRRLSGAEIGDLCHLYSDGASIDALARQYKVNRTTLITHLDRAGIERPRVTRKMTEDSVARAAKRYRQGASLAVVAQEFGVHARTLAREFHRAGVAIRPRLGWQPQP